jgi:hypothetical protein
MSVVKSWISFAVWLVVLLAAGTALSENIDPYNDGSQYAYGENIGWVNFEPNVSGVGVGATVYPGKITGFIWAENIGWINLDPNDADPNTGIVNDGSGNLSGFAWGENVGWIKFNPSVPDDPNHYGVTIDQNGFFDGRAWGENIGWIHFRSSAPVAYGPRVCVVAIDDLANFVDDWLDTGPGLDGDLSGDNDVEFEDYSIFAWYWSSYCPEGWRLK